jgi:hypothetical protein
MFSRELSINLDNLSEYVLEKIASFSDAEYWYPTLLRETTFRHSGPKTGQPYFCTETTFRHSKNTHTAQKIDDVIIKKSMKNHITSHFLFNCKKKIRRFLIRLIRRQYLC